MGNLMPELLQQLDPNYTPALLLVVRTELERLRQERSTCTDLERRSNVPLATPPLVG
jgi:hypothetical protein